MWSRTWSNTGSRASLRMLMEGLEDIILRKKRRRGYRDSIHWRMTAISHRPLNIKQSSLCILWRLHIFPIKVQGFLKETKVRTLKLDTFEKG